MHDCFDFRQLGQIFVRKKAIIQFEDAQEEHRVVFFLLFGTRKNNLARKKMRRHNLLSFDSRHTRHVRFFLFEEKEAFQFISCLNIERR